MVYRLEFKVTQGALNRFNHHWVVIHWDVASNVSVIQLIPTSSICILYTIFSVSKKISRDYNPVSDDRAFCINNHLMYGTQISRTCFNIFMIFPLNSYVDLLVFLEYSLLVAILEYHSLFNISVNVLLPQISACKPLSLSVISACRPLCNLCFLLLVSNALVVLVVVKV